jgi:hypothetical protein
MKGARIGREDVRKRPLCIDGESLAPRVVSVAKSGLESVARYARGGKKGE